MWLTQISNAYLSEKNVSYRRCIVGKYFERGECTKNKVEKFSEIHAFYSLPPLCFPAMKGQCSRKFYFSSDFLVCFSDPTQDSRELAASCLMELLILSLL